MQAETTGFIDIHTHLLPGVDDGAQDLQEAMALLRMAWEDGTRGILLTPHYRDRFRQNTPEQLANAYEQLREAVAAELPEMQLFLGNEAHYEAELPELFDAGRVLPLNQSRYVLLEFRTGAFRSRIVSGISELVRYGYTPIIAHAERYEAFRKDKSTVDAALDMGALIQLNASSIMGKHGFAIKHFCHRLLKQGKVHFIASDAHDAQYRSPLLQQCWKRVSKKYTHDYAAALFWENAQAFLGEQDV